MQGISAAIKALFDSLATFFSYAETAKERQSETVVIKDAKGLKKASNIAEDIIILAFQYRRFMSPKDQKKLLKLTREFKKVN